MLLLFPKEKMPGMPTPLQTTAPSPVTTAISAVATAAVTGALGLRAHSPLLLAHGMLYKHVLGSVGQHAQEQPARGRLRLLHLLLIAHGHVVSAHHHMSSTQTSKSTRRVAVTNRQAFSCYGAA